MNYLHPAPAYISRQAAITNMNYLHPAPAYISRQAAVLPNAFSTMTIQDPTWNMDIRASSHLNSNVNNLTLVCVGDNKTIPVTNTGHSILPTLQRPLHLHNVLVTPNIIKNLIYVRQFTRDKNYTIEFDAFGFSVKDLLTRHILLRCDNSGDLYPVTNPSSLPSALMSLNPSKWHQRLGHSGDDVLRSLVSRNFISYNKEKSPHVCHACQLGKHVKLPFSSSTSIVSSCFEIIHSDIWTSPIISTGGFKYYVIFLDHFSHYLWINPLRTKFEVFAKFVHFRSYVKNQFKCGILNFQCDHGGEFDNTQLLDLFSTNGIQMRFSCPKTSQQKGKSERMIRTINNMIRTLLFQAHLPPTFWVEALHMAAYLLNLLPSTAIQNEILLTKLFNKQPNYSKLYTFGCLCYPYLSPLHKLAPRATPCIFLGYPAYHHGYRCLDLTTNKIIISRHVTFDEHPFPYGSITPSSSYEFLDTSPLPIIRHVIHNSPHNTPPPTPTVDSPIPQTPTHTHPTPTPNQPSGPPPGFSPLTLAQSTHHPTPPTT
ncbi:ribonuclease H-like domain-containing protein [Tanacetum coccineum]